MYLRKSFAVVLLRPVEILVQQGYCALLCYRDTVLTFPEVSATGAVLMSFLSTVDSRYLEYPDISELRE